MRKLLCLLMSIYMLQATAQPTFQNGNDPAPAGKKWVKNNAFSDEFNGSSLDKNKWLDYHPYWVGRSPAIFKPNAVTVTNGKMQIKNYKLSQSEWVNGNEYTIAGGAVSSVATNGHYGYYECRMKASKISMSSTFWMKNRWDSSNCPKTQTELDIIECIGGAKESPTFATHMHSNTHYIYNPCSGAEDWKSRGNSASVGGNVADDYHVYGAYWKDANTILFYIDGVYQYTVNPRTDYSSTPFDRPMQMFLVTETYDWQTPPTAAELADDSKNTTYYDWVRAWTLEDDPQAGETISFGQAYTSLPMSSSQNISVQYVAQQQREVVVEIWKGASWLAASKKTVAAGTSSASISISLPSSPTAGTDYILKASIRPVGTDWTQNIANAQINNISISAGAIIADGTYEIRSVASGKNLGAPNWNSWNATEVTIGNYDDQKWILSHQGNDIYTIKLKATWDGNKYLEVPYAACENGSLVKTHSSASGSHQKWKIEQNGNAYTLRPHHCWGQALDVRPQDDNIHTWAYDANNGNQQWQVIPASNQRQLPDASTEKLILYPNPSDGKFHLQLPASIKPEQECQLMIYSLSGKKIYEASLTKSATPDAVSPGLSQGIYLLMVKSGKAIFQEKLIIE
ncbi:RICIN domain-containing protein [Persicobacter diffluens]